MNERQREKGEAEAATQPGKQNGETIRETIRSFSSFS